MTFDRNKLRENVEQAAANWPSPHAPEIKNKDYEAHARVAALLHENPHPSPDEVTHAYHLLKNAEVSPHDFESVWSTAKPLANRLLGRPPTIHDVKQLAGGHPADVHSYYMGHPHPEYPEVKAGDFAKYHHAATPIANSMIGRDPVPLEVARFAIAGYDSEAIQNHYTDNGKGGDA